MGMTYAKFQLLVLYLRGFMQLFLTIGIASLMLVWVLQVIAISFGEAYPWADILFHIFLSTSFLVLFPGQKFWTFVVEDADGKSHVIVGALPPEEDQI